MAVTDSCLIFSSIVWFLVMTAISLTFSSLMVVVSYSSIYAVLFLILSYISASVILLILKCAFLALIILITIYVRAVAVLFLFVVLLLDIKKLYQTNNNRTFFYSYSILLSSLFLVELLTLALRNFRVNPYASKIWLASTHQNVILKLDMLSSDIEVLGQILSVNFVVQFLLIVGLILFLGIVGSIVISVNFTVKKAKLHVFYRQFSQSFKSTNIVRWLWFFLILMFITSGEAGVALCDANSGPPAPATNAAAPSLTWAEICKEGVAACVIGYLVSNGTPAGFVVSTLMLMTLPIICRKNGGKSAGDATDGRTSPEEPEEVVVAPLRDFAEDGLLLGNHSSAVTLVEVTGNGNAPEEGVQSTITRWVIESWSNFLSDLNSMEFSPALQELLNGHIKVFMQAAINYPGITSGVLVVLITWSCQYFSIAGPAIVFVKLMQGFRWPIAVLWGGAAAGAGAYASSGFFGGPPGPPVIPIPEPAPKPSTAVPTIKEVQEAAPLAERLRLAEILRDQARNSFFAERDNLKERRFAYQRAVDRARELNKDALCKRTEVRWEASKTVNSLVKRGLLPPLDLTEKRKLVGETVAPFLEDIDVQVQHNPVHLEVYNTYRELQESKERSANAETSYRAAVNNVIQVRRQG